MFKKQKNLRCENGQNVAKKRRCKKKHFVNAFLLNLTCGKLLISIDSASKHSKFPQEKALFRTITLLYTTNSTKKLLLLLHLKIFGNNSDFFNFLIISQFSQLFFLSISQILYFG